MLTNLLRDRSPLSIGSVADAFTAVCPTRLDLLHPHYRRLCRTIIDADEWGQVDLIDLLIRYARTMLPRPGDEVDPDLRLLLASAEPLFQSQNPAVSIGLALEAELTTSPTGCASGSTRLLLSCSSVGGTQDYTAASSSTTYLT